MIQYIRLQKTSTLLISLKKYLTSELRNTEKVLTAVRIAWHSSPTAMESHSDTSRSKLESEFAMHELRLKKLRETFDSIPNKVNCKGKVGLWCFVKAQTPSGLLEIIIVPEGLGGIKVGKVQCVSDKTPMGLALLGKKQGDKFFLSGTRGQVLLVA